MKNAIRVYLIGWIWLVTAYDIWCCQFLLPEDELNPLAKLLMVNFGVWSMVACKVVGTWVVTELLRHLPFYYSVIIALLMVILTLILCGALPI